MEELPRGLGRGNLFRRQPDFISPPPALLPEGEGTLLLDAVKILLSIFCKHNDPPPKGGRFTDPLYGALKSACVAGGNLPQQVLHNNQSTD
jgi:hypothetical protein